MAGTTSPSSCPKSLTQEHNYFDGACLNCGQETPERTPDTHELTQTEINALWRILKNQYISYEDLEASAIATRIGKIAIE